MRRTYHAYVFQLTQPQPQAFTSMFLFSRLVPLILKSYPKLKYQWLCFI